MLNKGKKRTTRVDQSGPISDRDATRRQIETKNRRLNQDGRTKVIPMDHPLLANINISQALSNPNLDPTNTTNDSFGPTSLYAESNDSAQSENSASDQINLNDIDIDVVQTTPLDLINEEEEEVFVAEINFPADVSSTPTTTKSSEPRKSGRVGKKPASFKDSVLTTIKSKSKLLIKKSGVVANPQVVIDPVASSKKLKGIGKKSESNEGPEVYNEDDGNEEDSEKSDSDDTSSSTDSESDEKKVKEKKKDKKEKKDKKNKKR
jgi:hypothetical protein